MKIALGSILFSLLCLVDHVQGQTWRQLNPPPNIFSANIMSIVSDSAGHLYAAGNFMDSANEFSVATWNGSTWAELGAGGATLKADHVITSLATDRQNNLYAAGGFTDNTGNYYVAKWNGSNWSELGTGANALNPDGPIYAMAVDSTGNVYVAGGFTDISGNYFVAKWNGVTWAALNTLKANETILCLTADKNNVYAAGDFTNVNGERYVAKWDGATWAEVGALHANDNIRCITADHDNNIYAAGDFKNSSGDFIVAKWDGTTWNELGSLRANGPINVVAVNDQNMLFTGGFGTDTVGFTNVDEWNGSSWTEIFNVGYDFDNAVRAICFDHAGNLYAGGDFKNGGQHNYVGVWNGSTFKELGRQGEFLPVNNGVLAVIPDSHGNVYAIGDFYPWAGTLEDIAKWDGIGWTRMQSADPFRAIGWPEVITIDSLDNIYTAGRFTNSTGEYYVAKWDGNNWTELASATKPLHGIDHITGLTVDKNNHIYAVGLFTDENNTLYTIARWDGTGWDKFVSLPQNNLGATTFDNASNLYVSISNGGSEPDVVAEVEGNNLVPVGALNPPDFIYALTSDRQNNLYVSGRYDYVSKWDGTSWHMLGDPLTAQSINALMTDPAGNVYAAADDPNNLYVGKWDGSSWSPLGGRYSMNVGGSFHTISRDIAGDIYAAGNFSHVAVYGDAVLMLQEPVIAASTEYCSTSGNQIIKILNLPSSPFLFVSATLDGSPVSVNGDSSIHFDPAALSAGHHRVKVSYRSASDTLFDSKDFSIVVPVTPDVNLSASITTITTSDPVVITAVNAAGGGTAPKYTFATDRNFSSILQAESLNNVLNLDPANLADGENRIYVRMRTSDSCYITQTVIDSVSVNKPVILGITDVDYPNQPICAYPNPFGGSFTLRGLQTAKSYTIRIFNVAGQVIYKREVNNSNEVIIARAIPQGIYWLSIFDNSRKRILGNISLVHAQ